MKQVLQNVSNGTLHVAAVPDPSVQEGQVLIANRCSLISAGTEKLARDLAQKSLLAKAKARPDHVRRVLEKVRSEGFVNTMRQVRAKLDEPMSMGYSSAGVVIACGPGVQDYKVGHRVASNAPHAEIATVPKHLVAGVPDNVPLDQAAFTVLGAIAMQGIRLAKTSIGETAFVIGLGLIGQITAALLKAAGVRVIATDLDASKCELALTMGAEVARPDLRATDVMSMTGELGADAVLITASTESNGPIDLAAGAVRRKGRVVLIGVVGLELDRRPFYFKEAEFVVSCSYGPGRYDPVYEERGRDYPAAYVRWTEQRNMQAVLDLMGSGRLDLSPLVSHRFSIDEAAKAYELMESGSEAYLGIMLEYPRSDSAGETRTIELGQVSRNNVPICRSRTRESSGPEVSRLRLPDSPDRVPNKQVNIGCLGAGNFARSVLLPKLCAVDNVSPVILCSAGGVSAAHTGKKLGFARATSDEAKVLADAAVDAVFVITRHDLHARQVIEAVRAGKHVFVEKPLCLTVEELRDIQAALNSTIVMVGFNRRFSPAANAVKRFFHGEREEGGPLTVSIRFNAGAIPADHWTQDEAIGGGRIIGEACHAIDLGTYLTGSPPVRVFAESIGGANAPGITDDQCFITLRHANGSVCSIAYLAGGDRAFPKERVEIIGDGKVAVIDDFRRAEAWSGGKRKKLWRGRQDKGHRSELEAFVEAITGGRPAPIPWEELKATTLASILAVRSLRAGVPYEVPAMFSRVDEQSNAA